MSTDQATATNQMHGPPPGSPVDDAHEQAPGPPAAGVPAAAPPAGTGVTYDLAIDDDGRVALPGTRPGDRVSVTVAVLAASEPAGTSEAPDVDEAGAHGPAATPEALLPIHLRSDEEKAAVIAEVLAAGRRVRETATDAWMALDHGDWLYDENGLPT